MKIYTKTGDEGQTSLLGGTRVPKSHWRLKIYGGLDELNSHLGLVNALLEDKGISASGLERLENYSYRIQSQLFSFGAHLACEDGKNQKLPKLSEKWVSELEKEIDYMEDELEPLKNFILPGGSRTSGVFHMARSLCRRVERELAELETEFKNQKDLYHQTQVYLNRLGDFLFVAARYCNYKQGKKDRIWYGEKN